MLSTAEPASREVSTFRAWGGSRTAVLYPAAGQRYGTTMQTRGPFNSLCRPHPALPALPSLLCSAPPCPEPRHGPPPHPPPGLRGAAAPRRQQPQQCCQVRLIGACPRLQGPLHPPPAPRQRCEVDTCSLKLLRLPAVDSVLASPPPLCRLLLVTSEAQGSASGTAASVSAESVAAAGEGERCPPCAGCPPRPSLLQCSGLRPDQEHPHHCALPPSPRMQAPSWALRTPPARSPMAPCQRSARSRPPPPTAWPLASPRALPQAPLPPLTRCVPSPAPRTLAQCDPAPTSCLCAACALV